MQPARDKTDGARDHLVELFTGNTVERVTELRAAADSMAVACVESLRESSGAQVQLDVQAVESAVAGDVLAGVADTGVSAFLRAGASDTNLVISADRDAAFALAEALLGGDGSEPAQMPDRPLTRVEARLAILLFEVIAKALEVNFSSPVPTRLAVEEATDRIDPNLLGRPVDTVSVVKLRLEAADRGGEIRIAFPQSAVRLMRQAPSARPATKETTPPDAHWLRHMRSEMNRASVKLSGVLDEKMSSLGDVSSFSIGQVIELNATMTSRVWFECNGERMVWCHLGKSNGTYAMRVDGMVDPEQEFMDEILSG